MWGKRSGTSLLSVAHLISMPVSMVNERAGKPIFAHEPSNLLEAGGRGWHFGGSSPSATAKLVWVPAVREDERAGHFFIVRCRRIVFTLWVGGKRAGVFLFSAKTHLVCMPVGNEGECVALLFYIYWHLSFSGQGTEVGFCFGSLPWVVARLVGTPVVEEGKRAWRCLFCSSDFLFSRTGSGGGEDASGFLLSGMITFICMAAGRKGVRELPFYLRLRLLKCLGERGGGGVLSDCLPSALVRSVCMPAGRESKRVRPVLIIPSPFIFTDSLAGREKGCRWLSNLCGDTLTMYVSGWIGRARGTCCLASMGA